MADLAQLNLVINSAAVSAANNQLNIMIGLAGKVEVATKNMGTAHAKANEQAGGMLKTMMELAAAYLSLETAKKGLEAVAQEENLVKGLTNITGSAETAKNMMQELENYTTHSEYGYEQLGQAAKLLVSLGTDARQVVPDIKAIGDELNALGASEDALTGIVGALSRMSAEERVNTRSMREFTSVGIPAWKILAEALGTDVKGAMRLVQQGAVDSGAAMQVLIQGMRKAADGAKATDDTLGELYTQIKNNLFIVLKNLAREFVEAFDIKGKLSGTIEVIKIVGAVLFDAIRILAGLPPKFEGARQAATILVAVIRALVAIFEIMLALQIARFFVEAGSKLINFATGLSSMSKFGQAAVMALVALTLIEVGRWAADNYKPVAAFVAKLETASKLFQSFSDFAGKQYGSVFGGDALGMGTEQSRVATEKLKQSYEDTMAEYDKMQRGIDNRPDKPLTSFTDKVSKDLASAQKMINAFLGGKLDIKAPDMEQLKKQLDDLMKSQESTFNGPQKDLVTLDPNLKRELQQIIDHTTTELALVGKTKDQQQNLSEVLKIIGQLKQQGLTDDRDAKQYLIDNGISMQSLNDLWDQHLVKSQEAVKLLGKMYEASEKLRVLKDIEEFAKGIGDSFAAAFGDFLSGAKKAKDAIQDLIKAVEQLALKKFLAEPLSNMISGSLTTIAGKAAGLFGKGGGYADSGEAPVTYSPGGPSGGVSVTPEWHGDIFGRAGIMAFAGGGVFDSPTGFTYGGGRAGVLGENGPEAVIPLTRGSNGKLGLAGGTTTNNTVTNHYHMNITTPNADTFRKSGRQIMAQMNRAQAGGIS